MTVFNSLGSNYDFSFVFKSLFAKNKPDFAANLQEFLQKKYNGEAHLVYKGREALELVLKVLDLSKDSYVAINGYTCYAVYKSIANRGYRVYYLDIESKSFNFSAKELEKALQKNPLIKVVIIQNTLGYPCEIEKISKVCKEKNIILIEDLAHSIGTVYSNGKEAGTVGDFVILSFSQDKMIDAVSGGALIIKNKKYQKIFKDEIQKITLGRELLDRLYPLFTWTIRKTYSVGLGKFIHYFLKKTNLLSTPMDESFYEVYGLPFWYCFLVLDSFNRIKENLTHRRKIANIYKNNLDKKLLSESVTKLINSSSNLRFPVFVNKRDRLIGFLEKEKIYISDTWYDSPIGPKRYLKETDYNGQCPNSEETSSLVVNLPTHINISEEDALIISQKISQWLKLQ